MAKHINLTILLKEVAGSRIDV